MSRTPTTKASPRPTPPKVPTTRPPNSPDRPAADRGAIDRGSRDRGPDRPVTLAAIIGAHGVTGEVRLKLFTDDLSPYPTLSAGERSFDVKSLRPGPNGAVARLAGVTTRDMAEALRGTALTVPRSALPPLDEGEYYHADLIGLPVVSTAGEDLGHVVAIDDFGAGDVIEIARPDGRTFMVAMRPDAVPEWSHDRLVVDAAFAA